jgi:glycosyltransferase involved in cell wall biosynthesis
MPVYERKEYFKDALESALNQTVKCKVIVIDNCSSHDYFEQICKEKGVTYYRNDRNIGLAPNFARGFELAKTEYVMNLQDDDLLSPDYVEAFVNAVEKHPELDIFFTDFSKLTAKGTLPHQHTLPFGYMENGDRVIEYGIRYKLGFPYISSAIKRTNVNGFDKYDGGGSYDWAWLYSNADHFSFYGDSRRLYSFREHDMQHTKKNAVNYNLSTPYIYEAILKEKASDPELKKLASKRAFWELVHLKAVADNDMIDDILRKDNIYSRYLRDKIDNDIRIKTIFFIPKSSIEILYRSMKRVAML